MIFTDPWKILAWFCVVETWPKVEDVKTPACPVVAPSVPVELPVGILKFGWFRTLKASSLKTAARLSWIGKVRETCASN